MFKQIESKLLRKALEELTATEELETRIKIVDFLLASDDISLNLIFEIIPEANVMKGLRLYLGEFIPGSGYNELIIAGITKLAKEEYK